MILLFKEKTEIVLDALLQHLLRFWQN